MTSTKCTEPSSTSNESMARLPTSFKIAESLSLNAARYASRKLHGFIFIWLQTWHEHAPADGKILQNAGLKIASGDGCGIDARMRLEHKLCGLKQRIKKCKTRLVEQTRPVDVRKVTSPLLASKGTLLPLMRVAPMYSIRGPACQPIISSEVDISSATNHQYATRCRNKCGHNQHR